MNFRNLWSGLGRRTALPLLDAPDQLILTQTAPIHQVMEELVQFSRTMALHRLDGIFLGSAVLRGCDATSLTLTLQGNLRKRTSLEGANLSLTASTSTGAVFFTLKRLEEIAPGCWRAALPKEVIRVQSREHFRLTGVSGPRHVASLILPETTQELTLHNLSESGLGFRGDNSMLQGCEIIEDSTLRLDDTLMRLPTLRIVFNEPAGARHWRIGAEIHGMSQSDARTLRLWINAVETARIALKAA